MKDILSNVHVKYGFYKIFNINKIYQIPEIFHIRYFKIIKYLNLAGNIYFQFNHQLHLN